ncbi:MAG TPA: copper homeostasis protein CutC [Bacteroidota bacterium]|nr:copper homeostasis protein CutC [Bacteroidota bacterium]
MSVFLEISLDSTESAIAAERGGAHRVELCSNLSEGGTTPDLHTINETRKNVDIPVHVMIRPRPGDFVYSDDEFEKMMAQITSAWKSGVNGAVVGVLTRERTVDRERMQILLDHARTMTVTFHRAFDDVEDPDRALEELIDLGVDRILTSGQKETAGAGIPLIARLQELARGRIIVMAGCGINPLNVGTLMRETGVREIHVGRAVRTSPSHTSVEEGKVRNMLEAIRMTYRHHIH